MQGADPGCDLVLAKPCSSEKLGGVGASHAQVGHLHDQP